MRARSLGTTVLSVALVLGGAALVAPSAAAASGAVDGTQPRVDERRPPPGRVLRQNVRDVVRAGAVGVTAQLVDHGRAVRATGGFARLDPRRRAAGDPRFRAASMTKQVISVLAFQQVEAGRWTLGTTVGDVLPLIWPEQSDVTLGQLLSHRSGLPDYLPALVAAATGPKPFLTAISQRRSERSLVAVARALEPLSEPGTAYSYSNTNYVLVGLMLRRATGMPLARLVEKRVLRPARMDRSRYATDKRMATPRLREYGALGKRGRQLDLSSFSPSMFAGAGALVSTARDLNRFQRALSRGRLVDRGSLRTMRSVVSGADEAGVAYGYGSYRIPDPCRPGRFLHGHDGASWGTHTLSFSSPDGTRRITAAMTGRQYTQDLPAFTALNRLVVETLASTCTRPASTRRADVPAPLTPLAPSAPSMMVPWT